MRMPKIPPFWRNRRPIIELLGFIFDPQHWNYIMTPPELAFFVSCCKMALYVHWNKSKFFENGHVGEACNLQLATRNLTTHDGLRGRKDESVGLVLA
jgi:hypothetical protein